MPLTLAPDGYPELPVLASADCSEMLSAMSYQGAAVAASALYPTAGLGLFVPMRLSTRRTYVRAWWLNGSAVAGNADLGVYTISGTTATRLQSIGATAQAGTTAPPQMQTVTISWTLDPGLYYLAFSHSEATTGQYWRGPVNVNQGRTIGLYQAAAQSPLAASVTVVAYASTYLPYFGLAEQAVI